MNIRWGNDVNISIKGFVSSIKVTHSVTEYCNYWFRVVKLNLLT